jgi:chromosome segregation ATPase
MNYNYLYKIIINKKTIFYLLLGILIVIFLIQTYYLNTRIVEGIFKKIKKTANKVGDTGKGVVNDIGNVINDLTKELSKVEEARNIARDTRNALQSELNNAENDINGWRRSELDHQNWLNAARDVNRQLKDILENTKNDINKQMEAAAKAAEEEAKRLAEQVEFENAINNLLQPLRNLKNAVSNTVNSLTNM